MKSFGYCSFKQVKSRHDNILKVIPPKSSLVDEDEGIFATDQLFELQACDSYFFLLDTEKEDEGEAITNGTTKIPTTTESIEFDNGFKLDLSSIDGDLTDPNTRRRSIDFDYEAINRSNARVGDWQTNFTLIESKVLSIHTHTHHHRSSRVVLVSTFRRRNIA